MDAFVGIYKLGDSKKFEEFMSAIGVSFMLKQFAKTATPVQTIVLNEGEMHIKTTTTLKTTDLKFKLGEEFEEKTADGRTVKTTMSLVDGKLIQVQPGTPDIKITREIKDGNYIMTLETKDKNGEDIVCIRDYKPVEK